MKNRPRALQRARLLRNGRLKRSTRKVARRTGPHIVCALACAQQRQIDCAVSELRWSILMMGRETNSGKCSAGGATADWRVMNPHQLAHRRRSVITPPARSLALYPAAASLANSILDPAHPRCNLHARTLTCWFMYAAFLHSFSLFSYIG